MRAAGAFRSRRRVRLCLKHASPTYAVCSVPPSKPRGRFIICRNRHPCSRLGGVGTRRCCGAGRVPRNDPQLRPPSLRFGGRPSAQDGGGRVEPPPPLVLISLHFTSFDFISLHFTSFHFTSICSSSSDSALHKPPACIKRSSLEAGRRMLATSPMRAIRRRLGKQSADDKPCYVGIALWYCRFRAGAACGRGGSINDGSCEKREVAAVLSPAQTRRRRKLDPNEQRSRERC
jgi:hypothetical protein